ncbi:MAG: ATP-dependent helicase HrpB [Lentisphaerae bacterium]|nr:ATP-dependent helicase HrpB [Lentisphaerota bacterium]
MSPDRLPIYDLERALVAALGAGNRVVVEAPTGSGKSTQIPQMLLDHGLCDGQIVVLQPRRLATRLLAARVADERGARLGGEVGYQIRFEDVSSASTRIKFVTEGILLRHIISNPTLRGIGAIVFDEFHERHLYGDITLARALQIQSKSRPDLRILVMSATLAGAALEQYLTPCSRLVSAGRMFPVDVRYLPRPPGERETVWASALAAFEETVRAGDPGGDVLVFMPGAYEIGRTLQAFNTSPAAKGFVVLPLHGELSPRDQDAAVSRYDRRKIVISTNVAETSLTIDGIRLVIDSGLARMARYDAQRGINTLLVEKISRASADQRSGRAGRTAPGLCLRLWTERDHRDRAAHELPEVKRVDLAEMVLMLKAQGVSDVRAFPWFEAPDAQALGRAEQLLVDLGAVAAEGPITALGRRMLAFPVHPRYARMLLAAAERDCVYEASLIAALTQGRDLLLRRTDSRVDDARADELGEESSSDFLMIMRAWHYAEEQRFQLEACQRLGIHAQTARQVGQLLDHFLRIARQQGLSVVPHAAPEDAIGQCVLAGFADHLARVEPGTRRCELVHGRRGVLARESTVRKSPLIVAADVREVEQRGKELNVLLSLATAVRPEWLEEMFPDALHDGVAVRYDSVDRRVVAESQRLFRDLPLDRRRLDPPPADAAAELLAKEVLAGRIVLKEWDHTVEQWILRVNGLSGVCPDLQIPSIGESERQSLIEQICHGVYSAKDVKQRPVWPVVRAWLDGAHVQLVERHMPERLELSNGRRVRVTYAPHAPPSIAVRIQELYGVTETPRVARGRLSVCVQILAPNQRPVQITQDLPSFWREHYPKVKQELQRKYPKHEWR